MEMVIINKQQGFTLLELLVVVAVLATLAGITATAIGGYDQDAREQLVHTEMRNIAKAVYKFKYDTGYFPLTGIFNNTGTEAEKPHDKRSDLGFLYISPTDGGVVISQWDDASGRGWNGPYLMPDSQQRLHSLNTASKSYCDLQLINTALISSQSVIAVADTFESIKEYTDDDVCFVIHNDGKWSPKAASGQAYRYMINFENTNYLNCSVSPGCIALLSSGKNGIFDGGELIDGIYSGGDGDDIVKVLRVN